MMQYLWMFCAAVIAFSKGRGMIRWSIAAYFFGLFVPAVLLFLPIKTEKIKRRELAVSNWTEEFIIKNEVENIKTVDDLFKQLEKPKGQP